MASEDNPSEGSQTGHLKTRKRNVSKVAGNQSSDTISSGETIDKGSNKRNKSSNRSRSTSVNSQQRGSTNESDINPNDDNDDDNDEANQTIIQADLRPRSNSNNAGGNDAHNYATKEDIELFFAGQKEQLSEFQQIHTKGIEKLTDTSVQQGSRIVDAIRDAYDHSDKQYDRMIDVVMDFMKSAGNNNNPGPSNPGPSNPGPSNPGPSNPGPSTSTQTANAASNSSNSSQGNLNPPPPVDVDVERREKKFIEKLLITKQKLPTHKSRETNLMKDEVRKYVNKNLKRKDKSDPFPEPPTAEELTRFENNGIDGPTMENFRLDFTKPSMNTMWNNTLTEVFAEAYVNERRHQGSDIKLVAESFRMYLGTLRDHYETIQNGGKTDKQIKKQRSAARNSRRKELYKERKIACVKRPVDEHFVYFVQPLFELGPGGMSDDESDHVNDGPTPRRHYKILKMEWRSRDLRRYLRVLDLIYIHAKFSGDQPDSGNWVRTRSVSNKPGKYKPVTNLPENFYDATWLSGQRNEIRDALHMKAPVDLTIPEPIKRLAARYMNIKGPEDVPWADDEIDMDRFELWLDEQ